MKPEAEARAADFARVRIVDLVFGLPIPIERPLWLFALLAALAIHAGVLLLAERSQRSLESWSAALALQVHAALAREELVELAKPRPPPPPPAPSAPPPAAPRAAPPLAHRAAKAIEPLAQASNILARELDPNAPVDLTAETFVTGTASAYAGGVTASSGTSKRAVASRAPTPVAAPRRAITAAPDRSSAVSLEQQAWACPWPRQAESEAIDEQRVVLRVVVLPDGRAESARIVENPGLGFAEAAIECALRTRFEPARDRDGRAVKALSPPIRVRFTR